MTITHQSTDDLRAKLRQKLEKLVNPPEELGAPIVFEGEVIDVDAELGLNLETGKTLTRVVGAKNRV